ncbi:DUF2550 domain-containing protein [Corynebacterium guangdongense]|uniref:DUF2550 domain-containing protein n=1 Tax=Corynebacterium guangdongense TaxID=1783348 RepID=A0ABU1ZW11_9CORY|nr:DUF2550 domain-containing protein [Corynebacterium guangdongense]MDR7329122.1 hypothetical protein [Corynebacterium guangdongense]
MEFLMWVLIGLAAVAVCLAAWRFLRMRPGGTPVVLRQLPAQGVHGWRHGTLRYNGDDLMYYKLRSLAPSADFVFERSFLDFGGARRADADEQELFAGELIIVTATSRQRSFEFALDRHGAMALIAWIESAPDRRQVKGDNLAIWERGTRWRNR